MASMRTPPPDPCRHPAGLGIDASGGRTAMEGRVGRSSAPGGKDLPGGASACCHPTMTHWHLCVCDECGAEVQAVEVNHE